MSALTTIVTASGVAAVVLSAGGIVAAIGAVRDSKRSANARTEAVQATHIDSRLAEVRRRLEVIDLPGMTQTLEQVRDASDAAARLAEIDLSLWTGYLDQIHDVSEPAARLAEDVDVVALNRYLNYLRHTSDTAALLKDIDPSLWRQYLEIARKANEAAGRLEGLDLTALTRRLERLRQAAEPAAKLVDSIDRSGLLEQLQQQAE